MLAVEDVDDIKAPDFLRRMHVAVFVAVAVPDALPTTENDPVAVFVDVALTVDTPSTTVTAEDDVDALAVDVADASLTRVAVLVVDADPVDTVSSGPWPYAWYP